MNAAPSWSTPARDACAVVELPEEIDLSNAPGIGDRLIELLDSGVPGLIMDMTDTIFCDASGLSAIVRAHERGRALGAWMRLVVPHPHVRKVLQITGVDRLILVYPTRDHAQAAGSGAASA